MVPTYWEAMRVGWTILWRGVGSVLLVLMLMNGLIIASLPELSRTGPSWGAVLVPFAVTLVVGAFVIMPWLVKCLCTTSYPGFRLQFTHESSTGVPRQARA
jgi:hypothetical protein